jgi:predicted CoA-substrate-specific enzyme activase
VLEAALAKARVTRDELARVCATGYGRHDLTMANRGPALAELERSEISCHGLGTFTSNPAVRSVIDIGGQDCKVVILDDQGLVDDFVMNDKCAAGTGRTLELLARTLGLPLGELGPRALRSRRALPVSNKCSIFMELDVMQWMHQGRRVEDIARGITDTVARKVAALSGKVTLRPGVCISGGVSKNAAVVQELEAALGVRFVPLAHDPQIMNALGAACFARLEHDRVREDERRVLEATEPVASSTAKLSASSTATDAPPQECLGCTGGSP